MEKKIFLIFVLGFFLINVVSALTINFYYSDSCPYCLEMKPKVEMYQQEFTDYEFNWFNVVEEESQSSFQSEGFSGIPAFLITTNDCREIKFTGANDKKLLCELNQMSTKDCITYSADSSIGGSWFIE